MSRVYLNDSTLIAKAMKDHLNSWSKKPVPFLLEDLGKNVPSLMIQQLASAEQKRAYIDGSYIGVWNFSVYMRVDGEDTASRLDAIGCLNDLADWLMETDDNGSYTHLPYIDESRKPTSIEIKSTPSIAARYNSGIEDYQVIFSLEYKARRK